MKLRLFYFVLSLCASCPRVVTDCLGIANTLASGRDRATAPMRKLARVWNMVFNILDDLSSVLHALSQVIWMPAHGARSTIGVRIKSNDAPVSALDWRHNCLADAAAKAGAAVARNPASARTLRARFLNAYEHALAELSAVTVAANRHESQGVSIDGTIVRLIKRDASSMPRAKRPRIMQAPVSTIRFSHLLACLSR